MAQNHFNAAVNILFSKDINNKYYFYRFGTEDGLCDI